MKTESVPSYPVAALRELANSLQAALSVCMSGPTPDAVHRVRTRVRRIEAQLLLLAQLSPGPSFRKESKRLQKHLKQLRKLVAPIGDLDVQCELITGQADTSYTPASQRLISHLQHKRKRKTSALRRELHSSSTRIDRAMRCLLAAFGDDKGIALPATELIRITKQWFEHQHPLVSTSKQLHATRKSARVARYMAECAADSPEARELARRFEGIQQAGGEWHDWFQLALIARKRLRRSHPLLEVLQQKRRNKVEAYRGKLLP